MKLSESLKSKNICNNLKSEAKVVVQEIRQYEKTQETLAMLKLLAMTNEENPKAKGIGEMFEGLRNELNNRANEI